MQVLELNKPIRAGVARFEIIIIELGYNKNISHTMKTINIRTSIKNVKTIQTYDDKNYRNLQRRARQTDIYRAKNRTTRKRRDINNNKKSLIVNPGHCPLLSLYLPPPSYFVVFLCLCIRPSLCPDSYPHCPQTLPNSFSCLYLCRHGQSIKPHLWPLLGVKGQSVPINNIIRAVNTEDQRGPSIKTPKMN